MVVAKCSDESMRVVAKTSAMRPLKRSDHAVGLWGSGFDRAMFDVVGGADLIEGMGAGRLALTGGTEAVGDFLAVVGEDLADGEWRVVDQAPEEAAGGGC